MAAFPQNLGPLSTSDEAPLSAPEETIPIHILIVDDEPKNLTVLETVLNDPSYRLIRALTADQALTALIHQEFALLILDVQMPGMTGFELAQIVKQVKRTASVPIIFLTAYYSEDQHVLEGYGTGAVDYLHKPVNPPILRSKVAVFAELFRKTRKSELTSQALLAEVTERRRAEEELRRLNENLEGIVAERTSELREALEALREGDRRKNEFLAMLGHELRNPLGAIRHAVEVEAEEGSDLAVSNWAREVIDRQSLQLSRMVDDLLDVARIERGRIELRLEHLDLRAVISRALTAVQPLLAQKHHSLEISLGEDALPVHGDAVRLEQVFVNLLNNAAKYTGERGTISVAAHREAHATAISIHDTGIGLTAEMVTQAFDLFTQASTSLDRSQGGLGIGLTVVKALVETHGGSIVARSEGPGLGSTFTVRLPSGTPANAAGPPQQPPAAGKLAVAVTNRILIVDDNRDAANGLARILTRRGYEVRTAYDGKAGLELARAFRPHALLLDLGLPELDGYEICRRLRSDRDFPPARFIAISGYAQQADIEHSRAAGFDAHFAKPVDLNVLFENLTR